MASTPACRLSEPVHVFVKPDEQLYLLLEGLIVGRPVGGLVLGRERLAHALILPVGQACRFVQQSPSTGSCGIGEIFYSNRWKYDIVKDKKYFLYSMAVQVQGKQSQPKLGVVGIES